MNQGYWGPSYVQESLITDKIIQSSFEEFQSEVNISEMKSAALSAK